MIDATGKTITAEDLWGDIQQQQQQQKRRHAKIDFAMGLSLMLVGYVILFDATERITALSKEQAT